MVSVEAKCDCSTAWLLLHLYKKSKCPQLTSSVHSNGSELSFLKESAPLLYSKKLFLTGDLLLTAVVFHCELLRGLSIGALTLSM